MSSSFEQQMFAISDRAIERASEKVEVCSQLLESLTATVQTKVDEDAWMQHVDTTREALSEKVDKGTVPCLADYVNMCAAHEQELEAVQASLAKEMCAVNERV